MAEHFALLKEQGLPVPKSTPDPTVVIQNERRIVYGDLLRCPVSFMRWLLLRRRWGGRLRHPCL